MRTLRSITCWAALVALAGLAGCKSAEQKAADEAEMKKLEGTYTIASRDVAKEVDEDADDAPEMKDEKGTTYVIEKDKFITRFNGTPEFWQRIEIDATKNTISLLEIDEKGNRRTETTRKKAVLRKGTKSTTTDFKQRGAYKIDGDTLTITLGAINAKTNPTEVNAKGRGYYTLVLKKTGGKKEEPGKPKEDDKKEKDAKEEKKEEKKDKKEKSEVGEK